MATSKALTTANILPILKKSGFVTTENIVPILKKAGFATKDDVKEIVGNEVRGSERRMIRKMGAMRRDLAIRISKLATDTPTYKEFKELKEKSKSYI